MKVSKKDFDHDFKMNDLHHIANTFEKDGVPDKPARRQAYNDKVDAYEKDGLISAEKANRWGITPQLETTLYWL